MARKIKRVRLSPQAKAVKKLIEKHDGVVVEPKRIRIQDDDNRRYNSYQLRMLFRKHPNNVPQGIIGTIYVTDLETVEITAPYHMLGDVAALSGNGHPAYKLDLHDPESLLKLEVIIERMLTEVSEVYVALAALRQIPKWFRSAGRLDGESIFTASPNIEDQLVQVLAQGDDCVARVRMALNIQVSQLDLIRRLRDHICNADKLHPATWGVEGVDMILEANNFLKQSVRWQD